MQKIIFLLGSANISGGTYVILQHAAYLQQHGFDVTVALVFMTMDELNKLQATPDCWHPAIKTIKFMHIDQVHQVRYDIAIFTWWATLFSFHKVNANAFVYFVQSIESRFYAKTETFLKELVERTYQINMPIITEATWIQQYLQSKYQRTCALVKNGINKLVYTATGPALAEKSPQQLRILVEGPLDAPYKNIDRTIALCKAANVGEIWLLTSSQKNAYPGVAKVFSRVPISFVPKIYRSCDVLVKLSYVEGMFGPPLEMFHCGGTTITYDTTGYDEYIVDGVNALVVKTDDEAKVISYLQYLQNDRQALAKLQAGAKATAAAWPDWDYSSAQFATALLNFTKQPLAGHELAAIANMVKEKLHEKIPVEIISNQAPQQQNIQSEPLYESGAYNLVIPITTGFSKVRIFFGKQYLRLYIRSVKVVGLHNAEPMAQTQFQVTAMQPEGGDCFRCVNDNGCLNFDIQVIDKLGNAQAQFAVHIAFRPLALKQPTLVTM